MSHIVLRAQVALVLAATGAVEAVAAAQRPRATGRTRGDAGQTTAEYGLVLLGAAGIALLLVAWATKSGAVGKLFDAVMDNVIGKVK
jgi:hypothetical protein